MTLAHRDPLQSAIKLRQRIVAFSAKGPQVVFVSRRGQVDCCTLNSARHSSLASESGFINRVAGVFDASASAELLAASIREVAI